MALTSGFYPSKDGDRKYSALDFGRMFDGLIHDGIYATALNGFRPRMKDATSLTIQVDSGRAWFNHTWVVNDAIIEIDGSPAHPTFPRWDALVLTVDRSDDQRSAYLEIVNGVPKDGATRPDVTSTNNEIKSRYPLFYLFMDSKYKAGTAPKQVSDNRGQSNCPFVTGIVDHLDGDTLFKRWDDSFQEWAKNYSAEVKTDLDEWKAERLADYNTWKDTLINTMNGDTNKKVVNEIAAIKSQLQGMTAGFRIYQDIVWSNGHVLVDRTTPVQGKLVYALKV